MTVAQLGVSSLKKYRTRPALRAIDVERWLANKILRVKRIKSTPIFYLLKGKSVRQSWFKKTAKRILKKTAVTYLRKGIFLVPIWQKVPEWEMQRLKDQGIEPLTLGIISFEGTFYRLVYMQVEDLDHTLRQQNHVLDQYLGAILKENFPKLFELLERQEKIIGHIEVRKKGVANFSTSLEIFLRSSQRSLRSVIANAPLFRKSAAEDSQLVTNVLKKIIRQSHAFPVRPVFRKLYFARRSMALAIEHLQNRRLNLAKRRIQAALKNLEYPQL